MLRIDLKPGESVRVGDAVITLEHKLGKGARLAIEADRSVPIRRMKAAHESRSPAAEGLAGYS